MAAAGCLDAVAPTPTSTLALITPASASTRGTQTPSTTRFAIDLRVRNTGSRTIFLDRNYGRTEKLVDQKWELAIETTSPPFVSVRTIPPGQALTITYVMLYVRGASPESIYVEHVRGLYRARLRLSYNENGSDPLPVEASYSQPFAVE
jgi:hypothetical protein